MGKLYDFAKLHSAQVSCVAEVSKENWFHVLFEIQQRKRDQEKDVKVKKKVSRSPFRVVKQNQCEGVLIWESNEFHQWLEEKEKNQRTRGDKLKTNYLVYEVPFKVLLGKYERNSQPPQPQYSKLCQICKTSMVSVGTQNVGRKKSRHLDYHFVIDLGRMKLKKRYFKDLGLMISRPGLDFAVHQLCVDYVPKMVQNYQPDDSIEKIDGYSVEEIRCLRGTACSYCKGSKALTPCAAPKCKSKPQFLCLLISY